MAIEATRAISDVDLEAENKGCALVEHNADEVERRHQVLRWMLDEHPYLAHQLSVFNLQAH
jgi:hypothetical protein